MTTAIKIFIFTDCSDPNAQARQIARYKALFPYAVITCLPIYSDSEASGCIIDVLDAVRFGKIRCIIVGNIAPRTDTRWKNGAPFCFARIGEHIVIGTPTVFALALKLGIAYEISETDVESVCKNFLPQTEAARIANSQFRSYEYVPLLAQWLFEKKNVPYTKLQNDVVPHSASVWYVDCFGNIKTTLTESELKTKETGGTIVTKFGALPFFKRLADVPKGTLAVTIGSSGHADIRFAEIIVQGGSAAQKLNILPGHTIFD
jgi:hypothetical protein